MSHDFWHRYEKELWAYWDHEGRCFRCGGPLALTTLTLVDLPHCTAALCPRCTRAGGASRLRALYSHRAHKERFGMIDRNAYPGASRPALKPDSIGYPKVNAAVLTIADVDPDVELPEDNGGTRKVLTLHFREFPELTYYTNKTSRETLIDRFGTNEKKWIGERVPLIVVQTNNPKTKKSQPSLWVADAADWESHLARGKKARR